MSSLHFRSSHIQSFNDMDRQLVKIALRAIVDTEEQWNALDNAHKGTQFNKAIEDLEKWKLSFTEHLEQ